MMAKLSLQPAGLAFQLSFASVGSQKPLELDFRQYSFNHTRLTLALISQITFETVGLFPTCYTPPSLSGFKPCGRDKLGEYKVYQ